MKIKYHFVDGSSVEIDTVKEGVSPTVEAELVRMQRYEWAISKGYSRHTYSYEANTYEGLNYGREDEYFEADELIEIEERVDNFLDTLTPKQRRYVEQLIRGKSINAIAKVEGVRPQTVHESIVSVRKKVENFYDKHPDKTPEIVRRVRRVR